MRTQNNYPLETNNRNNDNHTKNRNYNVTELQTKNITVNLRTNNNNNNLDQESNNIYYHNLNNNKDFNVNIDNKNNLNNEQRTQNNNQQKYYKTMNSMKIEEAPISEENKLLFERIKIEVFNNQVDNTLNAVNKYKIPPSKTIKEVYDIIANPEKSQEEKKNLYFILKEG